MSLVKINIPFVFFVFWTIFFCTLNAESEENSTKNRRVMIVESSVSLDKEFAERFLDGEVSLNVAQEGYESITREIIQSVRKKLSQYSISIVEENSDAVIIIGVDRAVQFTTSNVPILEEAWATCYMNNREVFKVNFSQKAEFINLKFWNVQKTPHQIGNILGKKIIKELRKLEQ